MLPKLRHLFKPYHRDVNSQHASERHLVLPHRVMNRVTLVQNRRVGCLRETARPEALGPCRRRAAAARVSEPARRLDYSAASFGLNIASISRLTRIASSLSPMSTSAPTDAVALGDVALQAHAAGKTDRQAAPGEADLGRQQATPDAVPALAVQVLAEVPVQAQR